MAERVLIFENAGAIKSYLSALEKTLPKMQLLIDKIAGTGVEPDLSELAVLIGTIRRVNADENKANTYLETYIREKVVSKADSPQIGGVKISNESLMEMVEVPDCRPMTKALLDVMYFSSSIVGYGIILNLDYYELKEGVCCIKESANDSITEAFRIYLEDEKKIELYRIAKSIADNLNLIEAKTSKISERMKIADYMGFLSVTGVGEWEITPSYFR